MQGKFNRYNITTELAKKHSHATYLASPTNEPERQVFLTVFSNSLFHFPYERANLLEKAQRIKELQHPHILPILDMGLEEDQPFVVREYLPNGSLRTRLKNFSPDRLKLREALSIVSQIGEALIYAHEHNILHSNLKPENILFDANDQIFLTDFSLAGRKDAIIRDQTSQEYAFCYMAPEQFTGISSTRSDQYALGCIAYELIVGRVPFTAQSLATMLGQPNHTLPAPLSERVADLPPSLETAVLKTLAKDPDERFFDFSLFLEVIQSVLSPPPAFPLLRSIYSRKNRTISHPTPSTKAKIVSSPIRKRAAVRSSEPIEAFSLPGDQTAEPADHSLKHDRSSAVILEAMPHATVASEPTQNIVLPEEEIDDMRAFHRNGRQITCAFYPT